MPIMIEIEHIFDGDRGGVGVSYRTENGRCATFLGDTEPNEIECYKELRRQLGFGRPDDDEFKVECDMRRKNDLVVKGNTHPHRGALRAMGGIWDRKLRGWLMPDSGAKRIGDALVNTGSVDEVESRKDVIVDIEKDETSDETPQNDARDDESDSEGEDTLTDEESKWRCLTCRQAWDYEDTKSAKKRGRKVRACPECSRKSHRSSRPNRVAWCKRIE